MNNLNELEKTKNILYKRPLIKWSIIIIISLTAVFALLNNSFDFFSKMNISKKSQIEIEKTSSNGHKVIPPEDLDRKINERILTDESKLKLSHLLTMESTEPNSKQWTNNSGYAYTLYADEAIIPNSININHNFTKLEYTYTCQRKNVIFYTEDLKTKIGDQSFKSHIIVDVDYIGGILYFKNYQSYNNNYDTDCADLIEEHLKKKSGTAIELEFIEIVK